MLHPKKKYYVVFCAIAVAVLLAFPAAWSQETVTAHALVTAVPRSVEGQSLIPSQSVSVSEDGRRQDVSSWVPLRGERAGLELVVLLDDSSRSSVGLQFGELRSFLQALPPSTSVAVGYMSHGSPNLVQPFTTNHAAVAASLRLPTGEPGINGSPYFCLSDLVKHWPAGNRQARREVIMVTDGADPLWGRGYNPQDPYMLAAIEDAQKAGVVVYSIYYAGAGMPSGNSFAVSDGENYLQQVSSSTGGQAYFVGFSNPVSLRPFLDDIQRKLQNQYELGFVTAPSKELRQLKVRTTEPNVKLQAPERILARGAGISSPQ